jgi:hypothetical protein
MIQENKNASQPSIQDKELKNHDTDDTKNLYKIDDEFLKSILHHNIPEYVDYHQTWQYIKPRWVKFLNNSFINNFLFCFKQKMLFNALLTELNIGDKVLQVGNVYGNLLPLIAKKIAANTKHTGGHIDVIDVLPNQLELAKEKLKHFNNTDFWLQDASSVIHRHYSVISLFFIFSETPPDVKRHILENALSVVSEFNTKLVIIDYHHPSFYHPLRNIFRLVNTFLKPYAFSVWDSEIANISPKLKNYKLVKKTMFGKLYQKIVITKY